RPLCRMRIFMHSPGQPAFHAVWSLPPLLPGLPMTRLLSTPVLALLLALLAAAVYWPGLSGSFLFDDFPNIVTNDRVHLDALDTASLEKAAKGYQPGQIGRPLATLSFALNYCAGGK